MAIADPKLYLGSNAVANVLAAQQSLGTVSNFRRIAGVSLRLFAALLFIGGAIISLYDLQSDHSAASHAATLVEKANRGDNSAGVPSTVKPSGSDIANYVVPPNAPRYLIIPKLTVKTRVLALGITKTNALATSTNVHDSAWFNQSSLPGQPGAMIINGHVSSWKTPGVFYGLKKLAPSDILKIEQGDGTIRSYMVVKSQVYAADDVDMTAVSAAVNPSKPGLNLISCEGSVLSGTNEFSKRIVVFTEQL